MAIVSAVHLVSVLRAAGFRAHLVCEGEDGACWVVGPGFVCLPAGGPWWEWMLPEGARPPLTGLIRDTTDLDELLAELADRHLASQADDEVVVDPVASKASPKFAPTGMA